ncbi:MAG: hypothetical protein KAS32_15970 [Candidatus Peribacteraceae bacterium]|nr:hypothetical protein [Candidatus Peribacteraceae bacterium]
MKRPIKFRAWHKEEKIMCDILIINIEEGAYLLGVKRGEDNYYGGFFIPAPENGRFCTWDEIELIQFTGLTDKNGVEIYDGDVISVDWNDERCPIHNFIVKWNESYCLFDFEGGCPLMDKYNFEVIGNIHKNPELT